MEHPPIPPNSKHFVPAYFTFECGDIICLIETARWRAIVAAVARCGWLDECTRINQANADIPQEQHLEGSPEYERLVSAHKAREYAQAWADWGKQ